MAGAARPIPARRRPHVGGAAWPGAVALIVALLAAVALLAPAYAAPTFPALTGRVVDDANILSAATERDLAEKLQGLETSTGRQLVVVTLPGLQGYEIEDYGYQLGRAWGIGAKDTNDGALFIVAPNDRQVRIEVGYGLEPVLTDALSSIILQQAVLPKFREGDMEGGVVAGADAIVQQLALPDGEAKAQVATAGQKAAQPKIPDFVILLIVFVVFAVLRGAFGGRRRRGLGGVLPGIILGGLTGGRGGWSGGGGGGFSGGGGSFGGGGSSGRW